jgi:hypothetical protein
MRTRLITTAPQRGRGETTRRRRRRPGGLKPNQHLLLALRIVDCSIVDKPDHNRTARNRVAHHFAEGQRRAALEHRVDGGALQGASAGGCCTCACAPFVAAPSAMAIAAQQAAIALPSAPTRCYALASAATCMRMMRSGSDGGSPRLSLSTTSMPRTTSPITVYWPLRNEPSSNMMKNWLLAE